VLANNNFRGDFIKNMDKEYLIHDRPFKALLVFAFPMIVGNLFQQFYNMADSVVVGRFVSENALAAVGASYSLTFVFISIASGGGIGASVITGRYFGARAYRGMKESVYTSLVLFLATSVVLGTFGFFFGKEIMRILNVPESILDMAAAYLRIYFLGLPFLFMYNIFSAMFNAIGQSRIPLYLLIFSSVLNIFLDVFMVYSLRMGVSGVAWATLIAQGISAVAAFVLFQREMAHYKVETLKFFNKKEMVDMAKIALPSILQQSTVATGLMLVQSVVNGFGPEQLAGFSAGARIEGISVVPMGAMGNAVSAYTAQNIGAREYKRIQQGYHAVLSIVFFFAVIICIIVELFHNKIISLFFGTNGTVIAHETGSSYIQFTGFFYLFIGLKMSTDGILRGAQDMKMFTIANMVNLSIRVLISLFLAPVFGIQMIWYASPLGWLANFVISFSQYRNKNGKVRKLLEKKI
jgi:putative MATE family efflux protein